MNVSIYNRMHACEWQRQMGHIPRQYVLETFAISTCELISKEAMLCPHAERIVVLSARLRNLFLAGAMTATMRQTHSARWPRVGQGYAAAAAAASICI